MEPNINYKNVLSQLRSLTNTELDENEGKARKLILKSRERIADLIKRNQGNHRLQELLKFVSGTHRYYDSFMQKSFSCQLGLVFADIHTDGLFLETFVGFARDLMIQARYSSKNDLNPEELESFPLFKVFVEKNLTIQERFETFKMNLSGNTFEQFSKDQTDRFKFMLDQTGQNQGQYFSLEEAENVGFFGGEINFGEEADDDTDKCLRILSANFEMIATIEDSMNRYQNNNYPFNFFLMCGLQHAGGIATILNKKAVISSRDKISAENQEKYLQKHYVYPIYASATCNESFIDQSDQPKKTISKENDNSLEENEKLFDNLNQETVPLASNVHLSTNTNIEKSDVSSDSNIYVTKQTNIEQFTSEIKRYMNLPKDIHEILIDQIEQRHKNSTIQLLDLSDIISTSKDEELGYDDLMSKRLALTDFSSAPLEINTPEYKATSNTLQNTLFESISLEYTLQIGSAFPFLVCFATIKQTEENFSKTKIPDFFESSNPELPEPFQRNNQNEELKISHSLQHDTSEPTEKSVLGYLENNKNNFVRRLFALLNHQFCQAGVTCMQKKWLANQISR